MAQKTLKGYQLAESLNNAGITADVEICSLIARHSQSYQQNQVDDCSGHPAQHSPHPFMDWKLIDKWQREWELRVEEKRERLEKRLNNLADAISCFIHFQGDPRGTCIRLIPAKDFDNDKDIWNQHGSEIAVPVDYC